MKRTLLLSGVFIALQITAQAQWQHSEERDSMSGASTHKVTLQGKDSRLEVHCVDGSNYLFFFLLKGRLSDEDVDLWFDFGGAHHEALTITDPAHRGGMVPADFVALLMARRFSIAYTKENGKQGFASFKLRGLAVAAKQLPCSHR